MQFKERTDYSLISEEEYESIINSRSREQGAKMIVFNDQDHKITYATLYLKYTMIKPSNKLKAYLKVYGIFTTQSTIILKKV